MSITLKAKTLLELNMPHSACEGIDWSKIVKLLDVVNKDNLAELVKKAEAMNSLSLDEAIKVVKALKSLDEVDAALFVQKQVAIMEELFPQLSITVEITSPAA